MTSGKRLERRTIASLLFVLMASSAVAAASSNGVVPRVGALLAGATDDEPGDDAAIVAARDALAKTPAYPWYDDDTDGVRKIRIREAWDLSGWSFGPGIGSFGWLEWLMWGGLTLLLAGLIYLLVRAWLNRESSTKRRIEIERASESTAAPRYDALPEAIRRGARDLLAEARRLYEQGRYSEAVVYLFSHELTELDRRHIIRLAKGKTNRQYLREVGRSTPLARIVEGTMTTFEDAYFGNHAIDRRRFEACWSRLEEFDSLLTREAA